MSLDQSKHIGHMCHMFELFTSEGVIDFKNTVMCSVLNLPQDEHIKENLESLKQRKTQLENEIQDYIETNEAEILQELDSLNITSIDDPNFINNLANYIENGLHITKAKFVIKEIIVHLTFKHFRNEKRDKTIQECREHLETKFSQN